MTTDFAATLGGRPVIVTDVDLTSGITATIAVNGHKARVHLDSTVDRAAFATATGLTEGDLLALRDRLRSATTTTEQAGATLPEVDPFPTEVLPPVVRSYCASAAASLGSDIPMEMVAAPLLAMVGALAGSRLGLAVKGEDWIEHGGLFIAVIAKPGSAKTAAVGKARRPVARLQVLAKEQFDAELATYTQAHDAWSRDKANEDRGPEPERPRMRHFFTSDITMERLGELLGQNPGISIIVDELRGWLLSFDKYRAGRGSDRQQFLSLWGSDTIKIDRKGGEPLFVPHPVASIVGGLQSDFAGDFQLPQGRDGLTERILPIVLDHGSQAWTNAAVSARQSDDLFALIQQLDSLDPQQFGLERITVHLSPEARRLWVAFYNTNCTRVNASTGLAAGLHQKMANHAARFALILHALWHADDPRVMVSAETMAHAIGLADWWRGHIARFLSLLGRPGDGERDDAITRRTLRLLQHAVHPDGWATRSELYRGLGNVAPADLDATLDALLSEGRVERRVQGDSRKPRTSWRLVGSHFSHFSHVSPSTDETNATTTTNAIHTEPSRNGTHHEPIPTEPAGRQPSEGGWDDKDEASFDAGELTADEEIPDEPAWFAQLPDPVAPGDVEGAGNDESAAFLPLPVCASPQLCARSGHCAFPGQCRHALWQAGRKSA